MGGCSPHEKTIVWKSWKSVIHFVFKFFRYILVSANKNEISIYIAVLFTGEWFCRMCKIRMVLCWKEFHSPAQNRQNRSQDQRKHISASIKRSLYPICWSRCSFIARGGILRDGVEDYFRKAHFPVTDDRYAYMFSSFVCHHRTRLLRKYVTDMTKCAFNF